VAPPATPPAERALEAEGPGLGGIVLINPEHRRG
jgi:hypothetical protein